MDSNKCVLVLVVEFFIFDGKAYFVVKPKDCLKCTDYLLGFKCIIKLYIFCPIVAVCLDGTLPGYHFHPGFGSGVNSWLIQLEVSKMMPKDFDDEFQCFDMCK